MLGGVKYFQLYSYRRGQEEMDTPLPQKKIIVLTIGENSDCVKGGNGREGDGIIFSL